MSPMSDGQLDDPAANAIKPLRAELAATHVIAHRRQQAGAEGIEFSTDESAANSRPRAEGQARGLAIGRRRGAARRRAAARPARGRARLGQSGKGLEGSGAATNG